MRIYGNVNLVLDWDKNFSLISIKSESKKECDSNVEYMGLASKGLIRQIFANSNKMQYFYVYSYFSEKEQYSLILNTEKRFRLFLSLLKVQQVGPKLACQIASTFEDFKQFADVVAKNNVKELTKVPGLGNKKASLIIWHFSREQGKELLELVKDQGGLGVDAEKYAGLLNALVALGLSRSKAKLLITQKQKELADLLGKNKDADIGQQLKIVLN